MATSPSRIFPFGWGERCRMLAVRIEGGREATATTGGLDWPGLDQWLAPALPTRTTSTEELSLRRCVQILILLFGVAMLVAVPQTWRRDHIQSQS